MGVEKQGSKGGGGGYVGGFLQLFDWNGKSRKKLFSNKSDYPEMSKQGKRSSGNLPMTRLHLLDEDGGLSIKGGSDYSCASSVTDDEGNGIKAPGVVARLMGLDSLPTSNAVEPFSTPYFDTRSLRDAQLRRTPDFVYERQLMHSGKLPTKLEGFSQNSVESRPQKLMNRPIERFQTEMLPPKSAKSISITHHKLFSPIKSPGYIPTKNAAQIMEEAAKIIDPGPQASSKGKMPLVGSSSIPLKFRDLTEKMEAVQRRSRLPEASQRPVDSKAIKYLKGQSLNKSWNGVEDATQFRPSPSEESNSAGLKNKGKSISLAVQAKVNVQKRRGLSSSSSLSSQGQKEHKELRSNQPFKSQLNTQKNMQKKLSTPSASGVLRQNNQKQNCSTNRDKLPSKSLVPDQQGRKASLEASFGRNKTLNKVSGNSKVGPRKSVLDTNDIGKVVPLSRTKNVPRKKRAMEGDLYYEQSGFVDTVLVNKDEKTVQPNFAIEGHSKWMEDSRRKGMDVISFTFTSPMKKPVPGSQSSGLVIEKQNCFGIGSSCEKLSTDEKIAKLSSPGLNAMGGDALNILLEQKLRELAFGIESSSHSSVKSVSVASSASILPDSVSDLAVTEGHMLQGVEDMGDHSTDSSRARKELNCRHPSPVSILEPCFSNESCNSSDSADGNSSNGSTQCSSTQSQLVVDSSCTKKLRSTEADTELSDSASSTVVENVYRERGTRFSSVDLKRPDKRELEYVREVICNAESMFKDLASGRAHEMVNPCLFEQLENKRTWSRSDPEDNEDNRLRRRMLFDCVGECLDLRCRPYAGGSCKKWANGLAMVRKKAWLAEEIYREISGWKSMGDWMLDGLVDKDMSTKHGRWIDFEIEEFEVGGEIGRRILNSLIDEVVADISS